MSNSLIYELLGRYNQLNKYCAREYNKAMYQRAKRSSISTLKKINNKIIKSDLEEVRLFAVMRNESLRLPYFLKYYSSLNVDRLFIVDNNSTDNSIDIALSSEKVHVFKTDDTYKNHWFWIRHLLSSFGTGHWCLVVDIDELLSFPCTKLLSVHKMCQFLEASGSTALRALLLDMYSDQAVKSVEYIAGQNPLNSLSYFDTAHYEVSLPYFDRLRWESFRSAHFTGGMRERVFGLSNPITSLNKIPLFKNTPGTYLGQGMHTINGPQLSDLQGVVFHTKFLSDSVQEAQEESVREQHFNKAAYYKDFKREFDHNPDLCLANSDSVRYRDSAQLVELGLMKTNAQFEEFAQTVLQAEKGQ